MAVVWVREHWDGRGGESAGISDTRANRKWKIKTSNKYDDQHVIFATGLLPNLYDPHPSNFFLTCRRLRINQDSSSPFFWLAEAEYSSEPKDQEEQERESQPNPLLRRAKIRWGSSQYTEAIEKDINGQGIVNSAGDAFDPPAERDASRWTCTVSKNMAVVPPFLLTYADAINSGPFSLSGLSVETGKAKVMQIDISDLQTENDIDFYEFTYTLEFRKEGWKLSLLDQGLYYVSGGNVIPIPDDDPSNPQPVTSPKLLDGSGGILASPSASTAVFLDFDVYNSQDFSLLPLT